MPESLLVSMPASVPELAPDFVKVFRSAARSYRSVGRHLKKECAAAGVPADAEFWYRSAEDADRAALLVETLLVNEQPPAFIGIALDRAGLHPFAEVYATGETDLLCINAKALPEAFSLADTTAGIRQSAIEPDRGALSAVKRAMRSCCRPQSEAAVAKIRRAHQVRQQRLQEQRTAQQESCAA